MRHNLTYGEWLGELKDIITSTDGDYHELAQYYTFRNAYDDQKTPEQAYKDCLTDRN